MLGTVNVTGVAGKNLESVRKTAEEAKAAAEAAQKTAEAAKTAAEKANSSAETAKKDAADAKAAADMEKVNQAIEEGGGSLGGGSGNTIKITFEAAFAGKQYTVTDGDDTRTGAVPEGLVVSVKVSNCNSTYTIRARASNGVEYATSVVTGAYYGQYTAALSVFSATINVPTVAGVTVTAKQGDSTFTAMADSNGVAAVGVNQTGTYTVSAVKDGVSSNSTTVEVTAEGTYTAAVEFIVLTVTSEPEAVLELVNGETILTGGGSGTDVFYLPRTGTWTATLTSPEESSTKSISITEYKDYTLKVMFVSDVLDENDWEKIRDVADAGEGANYWSVGDTKTIVINGKVGNFTFSDLSVQAFILGFNHNSSKEGTNRIHFQLGKIGGKDVALCDSKYNSEITSAGYFNWNYSSNTNSGGWNGCYKRKTLYGNSNAPDSPLANSLMAALPADLRAVMKPVTKYTDNTGGGSDTASYVTATTDYLFDLAEYEVFGARSYANSAEQNYQVQYDYYKAGNSRIAYNHSSAGTAVRWGLRSPRYYTSYIFCAVNAVGSNTTSVADRSL
ncbi:MAG: hypothetical protein K2O18_16380, partial [Oscillospiraceae bacterium]|nr:hypothetical protein [Oscillospiraceae bacterium]